MVLDGILTDKHSILVCIYSFYSYLLLCTLVVFTWASHVGDNTGFVAIWSLMADVWVLLVNVIQFRQHSRVPGVMSRRLPSVFGTRCW